MSTLITSTIGSALKASTNSLPGIFGSKGKRTAAEIAEHEGRARARRRRDRVDRAVDRGHREPHRRNFQKDDREQRRSARGSCPTRRHETAVALLADGKSQSQKRDDAECRLELKHRSRRPDITGGSSKARSIPGSSAAAMRRGTYPRPTNGILVAITVMNSTFESSAEARHVGDRLADIVGGHARLLRHGAVRPASRLRRRPCGRSSASPRCRYRSGRRRCRICGRRARCTW